MGVRGLLDRSIPQARPASGARSLLGAYGSVVGLTLANPQTIISFAAAFGLMGVLAGLFPIGLTVGVLAGSATWWAVLAAGVALARRRLGSQTVRLLRLSSGALLSALGLAAVLAAVIAR